jgi:hypothetical protein
MSLINDENKKLVHKSKIDVLDFYFDSIDKILRPRIASLFDHITENIKKA